VEIDTVKKINIVTMIILFIFLCQSVFASGKKDEPEVKPLNTQWILCITAFDTSSLPESRRAVADVFTKNLLDTIKMINYRIRVSPEYAFYEDLNWSRSRAAAAKTLETRYNERTQLFYQGEPEWKYKRNIKKKDEEILKARQALEEIEAAKPVISGQPDFDILQANKNGEFPAAPADGNEYRFCKTQNVDGFLTGTILEYYGRFYVTLKLYALYTRTYIYEGDILFSADDVDNAVGEIAGRLVSVLSGTKPAAIAIMAEPDDTLVLINQSFAGRGKIEVQERPPGPLQLAFSSDGYKPQILDVELLPGELSEVYVSLGEILKGDVHITVPQRAGVTVYQGAMYVGEAPLTLRLPLNQLEYVNVFTRGGEAARAVFFTPTDVNEPYTLSLVTKKMPPSGQRRVNKARSQYYWAWGSVWLTGITAWVTAGIFTGQNAALAAGLEKGGFMDEKFYNDAATMNLISTGALILTGAAVAYDVFHIFKYLITATENATPIVNTGTGK